MVRMMRTAALALCLFLGLVATSSAMSRFATCEEQARTILEQGLAPDVAAACEFSCRNSDEAAACVTRLRPAEEESSSKRRREVAKPAVERATKAPRLVHCDAQALEILRAKVMETVAEACASSCTTKSDARDCVRRVCAETDNRFGDCSPKLRGAVAGPVDVGAEAGPDELPETLGGNYKTGQEMCEIARAAGGRAGLGRSAGWSGNVCYLNSAFFSLFGVNDFFYGDLEAANDAGFSPCGRALRAALRQVILKFRSKTAADSYAVPYSEAMGGFRAVLGSRVCTDEADTDRRVEQIRTMAGTSTYTSGAAVSILSQLTRPSVMAPDVIDAVARYIVDAKKKGALLNLGDLPGGKCRSGQTGHPDDGVKVILKPDSGLGCGLKKDRFFDQPAAEITNGDDDECPTVEQLKAAYRFGGTYAFSAATPRYDSRFESGSAEDFTPKLNVQLSASISGMDTGSSVRASLQARLDAQGDSPDKFLINLPKGWFVAGISASRVQTAGFEISKYIRLSAPTVMSGGEETRYYRLNGESVQHHGHYTALARCDGTDEFVYHDGLARMFRIATSDDRALTDGMAVPSGANVVSSFLLYTEITAEEYDEAVPEDDGSGAGDAEAAAEESEEPGCAAKAADKMKEWDLPNIESGCRLMEDPGCEWDGKKCAEKKAAAAEVSEESGCAAKAADKMKEWDLPNIESGCRLMEDPGCEWDGKSCAEKKTAAAEESEESGCAAKAADKMKEWDLPNIESGCRLMEDPGCEWDGKKCAEKK